MRYFDIFWTCGCQKKMFFKICYRLFSIWLPKELEFLRSEGTDLWELSFNLVEIPDAGSARVRVSGRY